MKARLVMINLFKDRRINIADISTTPLISGIVKTEKDEYVHFELSSSTAPHGVIIGQHNELSSTRLCQYLKPIITSKQREIIVKVITKNTNSFPYVLSSKNVIDIADNKQVSNCLDELINQMRERLQFINQKKQELNQRIINKRTTRYITFDEFNYLVDETDKLPQVLIVIDDLNEFVKIRPEACSKIEYLLKLSRDAGYHILATTSSVEVDNFKYMVCFTNMVNQIQV